MTSIPAADAAGTAPRRQARWLQTARRQCADQIIRRCIANDEVKDILYHCHSSPCGGHFGPSKTANKVLQTGYFWPSLFKDAYTFVKTCDRCQRLGNISRKDEMPLQNILEVEVFDLWGMDFMGHFPPSFGNHYILLAVDYVSKWVQQQVLTSH